MLLLLLCCSFSLTMLRSVELPVFNHTRTHKLKNWKIVCVSIQIRQNIEPQCTKYIYKYCSLSPFASKKKHAHIVYSVDKKKTIKSNSTLSRSSPRKANTKKKKPIYTNICLCICTEENGEEETDSKTETDTEILHS